MADYLSTPDWRNAATKDESIRHWAAGRRSLNHNGVSLDAMHVMIESKTVNSVRFRPKCASYISSLIHVPERGFLPPTTFVTAFILRQKQKKLNHRRRSMQTMGFSASYNL